jgi:DNA-binding LacI/PurR family transcriptional regulator
MPEKDTPYSSDDAGVRPTKSDPLAGPRRVTLADIARAVGVTPMTVSRALRKHRNVAEPLRIQIENTARELGYLPDPMLAALAHYRHGRTEVPVRASLAWINRWPDPAQLRSYREFDGYWQGASRTAEKFGYHLEEFVVSDSMPLRRLEQILLTRNIQGLLIPPQRGHPTWDDFNWDHFSVVRLSLSTEGVGMPSVASNQAANTMLAFTKIRERGYARIGFVGDKWQPRMFGAGFLWAQAGLPRELQLSPFYLPSGTFSINERALAVWLKKTKPDAILTEVATLPQMLKRVGYRVPEDIGLAALSVLDCPISAGIHQNPEEIGRAGVLALISRINDNDRGIPPVFSQMLITGSWVDGVSLPDRRSTPASQI